MDFPLIMLAISCAYLLSAVGTLMVMGARLMRGRGDLAKFSKALSISLPVGVIIGIIDLVALVLELKII